LTCRLTSPMGLDFTISKRQVQSMSPTDSFDFEDIKARFPNRFGYCVRRKRFDKAVSLSGTMAKSICFVSTGECTFTFDSEELHLTQGEFLALPGGRYHLKFSDDTRLILAYVTTETTDDYSSDRTQGRNRVGLPVSEHTPHTTIHSHHHLLHAGRPCKIIFGNQQVTLLGDSW